MAEENVYIALYKEDQIEKAAVALDRLHDLGIPEWDISVISGVPLSEKILGRPMAWTRVPVFALAGAVVGFLIAMTLNIATPLLYPIRVGGTPYIPIPTSIVVTFELTMLGLLVSVFMGVFIEMISPTYGPKAYHPDITNGSIGVLFTCPMPLEKAMHEKLVETGAELVYPPGGRP